MHPNRSLHEVPYPGTVRHRFLKGLGANSVGQIINLATRVVLPPLFLKAWGADVYGEWLVLSSFVAYLSLTDMGGQTYIVNRLAQAYAQQDFSLFRRVLHTGLAIFLFLPTAVFFLFTAAVLIVPPESISPILKTDHQVVVWVLAILAFQFVFSLPQGVLLGIYRAVGLLPRGAMLANLIPFLQLALMSAALWLGSGMVLIAGLQMLPYPLVALIAVWELNRRYDRKLWIGPRSRGDLLLLAFCFASLDQRSVLELATGSDQCNQVSAVKLPPSPLLGLKQLVDHR